MNRRASFLAQGNSFGLHRQIVAATIDRYRSLVEAAEALSMGFDPIYDDGTGDHGGGRLVGAPIELTFSKPLTDFAGFLTQILSLRTPFGFWGTVDAYTPTYAEVEAVDLHVGGRIRIEASPDMMQVHLRRGGCGNTISATEPSLQRHLDLA